MAGGDGRNLVTHCTATLMVARAMLRGCAGLDWDGMG